MKMKKSKALLILIPLLASCVSQYGSIIERDANEIQAKLITNYKEDKRLLKVVELNNVKIIVVTNCGNFEGAAGFADNQNRICIEGRRDKNGKIVINPVILGHETTHLLNFTDSEIKNPDEY